jgi:hypothetical protein
MFHPLTFILFHTSILHPAHYFLHVYSSVGQLSAQQIIMKPFPKPQVETRVMFTKPPNPFWIVSWESILEHLKKFISKCLRNHTLCSIHFDGTINAHHAHTISCSSFWDKCLSHNSIHLTRVLPIVNNLLLHCLTNLNQIVSSSSHKLYPSCVINHLIHWVFIFYHVPILMNKRGCMMMYVLFLHLLQSSFSPDLGAIVCFVFFHTSDIQTTCWHYPF